MQKQSMALKLKSDEDPNKLAKIMAALIGRYKCAVMGQEQRIAVILNAAGCKYAETIFQETTILKLKSKCVTTKVNQRRGQVFR